MIRIKKYPFIKQRGIKDCAAACTFMIIRYYKGYISMNKLEEMLKITRNGTTAYHIVKTLKEIGFNAYGIKTNSLKKTTIPFIANVIINRSYKHYIVVYKVTDKYIKIADPANTIKKIKIEDFYNIWTGVNIEMYPIKQIINEKPKTLKKIVHLIEVKKIEILKIGLLSLIITIISIIGSFYFQTLIDNENTYNIIVFFLIILSAKVLLTHIRTKMLIKLTNNIDKKIIKTFFSRIILQPYSYYHNHTTGEIISKINDISIFKNIIGKIILTVFIDLPLTMFSGLLLYKMNKKLFLAAITIMVIYTLIIIIYHKKLNNQINKTLIEKANINSFMTECISGFETIKGLNIENRIINSFKEKYDNYIEITQKLNNTANRQNTLKEIVNTLGSWTILTTGMILVKNNTMPLSTLITYNILVSFFLEPIKNIINLDFEIKEAIVSINKILEFTEENKKHTKNLIGDIEIKNLTFVINYNKYILTNINLFINEKEKVIITGESGSGKSTFLKILKGFYQDYEGIIKIGNTKIQNNDNIIYISEKGTIFTGTIKYNLKLKKDNIKRTIKTCYIDKILEENPLRENTLLEENGFNISSGQKQRICLARSLHEFDILLIDEALNGLDVNLERKIIKNLFKEYKEKTILIASHRLDNLDLFDHYIKLEKGKVVINAKIPRKEE